MLGTVQVLYFLFPLKPHNDHENSFNILISQMKKLRTGEDILPFQGLSYKQGYELGLKPRIS